MTPDGNRPPWWQGGAIYQIYVRSWYDPDGKGHGDLAGVIDKLDYLAWLGVDGIWLSPTMPSPDEDWGYDVADYLGVHPGLGTTAELDRLVAEAGTRGIAVLLDLVPNHTSSLHPWFVEARSGPGGAASRLVRMGRSGPGRWVTKQLAGQHRPIGVGARPGQRPVLPAQLPGQPARPQLVQPRGAGRLRGDHAILV